MPNPLKNHFYFNSNDGTALLALGVKAELVLYNPIDWNEVRLFLAKYSGDFINVMLSYDLKNSIEKLNSKKIDIVEFPELVFVVPETVYEEKNGELYLLHGEEQSEITNDWKKRENKSSLEQQFKARLTKEEYLEKINELQKHIHSGDIYEVNFCQQHFAENLAIENIDFWSLYQNLNKATNAPFSVFFDWKNWVMLGASPERYLQKTNNKLISQPIKGTRKRSQKLDLYEKKQEDEVLKSELINSVKERAENIMIVDLVRNDLSKLALRGTLKVDELCEIYTFETVHQMISTISCELKENTSFDEIIRATFPMGSMTGAPKLKAMELIEEYENFKRGLYAGSVGYIRPNGDFDLNVVIRSIICNKEKSVATSSVGGAITFLSEAEQEWEECDIKINRILASVNE